MTVVEAGKTCPHCGKKLRADNKRGACAKCLGSNGKLKGGMPRKVSSARPAAVQHVAAVEVKGTAVARFKVVAAALGFDGEGMLEEYAKRWLDGLRDAWLGALSKASDPSPAPVKHRQAAAPVRLHAAGDGEDRQAADTGGGA